MRDLLRSSINTGFAVAAAGTLAVTSAAPPAAPHSVPSVVGDVRLAAATTSSAAVTVAPKTATSTAAVTSNVAAVSNVAAATASKPRVKPSVTKRELAAVTAPLHRITKADNDTPSAQSSATGSSKPAAKHDDGDRHGARHSASKHDAQASASGGQGNRKHSD